MISEILFQYIQSEHIQHGYRYHGIISTICYRLYQIYQDCPRLWSRILDPSKKYLSNPGLWISKMLKKSKSAPLDIILSKYRFSGLPASSHPINTVIPHSYRWRSFDCTYTVLRTRISNPHQPPNEIASSVDGLADLQAPLLQKLVIKSDAVQWPKRINLLGGSAPSLRHLDIEPILLSWDSPLLSGLTFLRIRAVDVTADQYHRVLQSCPALEELHLVGQKSDSAPGNLAARLSLDIPLPKLKSLSLEYLHSATADSLLSSIKANPRTLTIVFPAQLTSQREDVLDTWILEPPSHHLLSKFTSSLDTVRFEEGNSIGPARPRVLLTHVDSNNDGDFTPDTSECIFGGLQSCPIIYNTLVSRSARGTIRSLVLDTNYPGMYGAEFSPRMLFEGLPELRELNLGGKCTLPWASIGPLANPVQSDAGSVQKWLCPHLDTLVFDGISVNIEFLWLFIESRYCRVDQVQKPDKLVNLRVVNVPTTFNWMGLFGEIANLMLVEIGFRCRCCLNLYSKKISEMRILCTLDKCMDSLQYHLYQQIVQSCRLTLYLTMTNSYQCVS
ncbi:hypothetical protein FRC02_005367 [Tulasnella sp. 418]|nr:hypothetical protein FRC02_005367 [Tulasnella sp. 418]